MSLKITIDGFTPNFQPLGLDDVEINIAYKPTERVFMVEANDSELTFVGDGYQYLFDSMQLNSFNGVHIVSILVETSEGVFSEILKSKLFIADCRFDLDKRQCKAQLLDNGYNAYILNNRSVEANVKNPKTKAGLNISAPDRVRINLINPPSNIIPAVGLVSTTAWVYEVHDLFRFFTSFMSDGVVGFQSDFFNNSTTGFGIVQGAELRQGGSLLAEQQFSFNAVFSDISKLFNLTFTIETVAGAPVARIENDYFFKNSNIVVEKENKRGVIRSFVQEFLHNRVNMGSVENITDGSAGALSYLPPYDFGIDAYYLAGNSNIDAALELKTSFLITDSNVIEDILVNNNDKYDDDWLIIAYDKATLNCLTPASDIFGDLNYYYNGEFTNKAVVLRHNLQGAAIKTIGEADEDFSGRQGYTQLYTLNDSYSLFQMSVNNVINDPSLVWDAINQRYVAIAEGIRNIRVELATRLTIYPQPDMPGPGGQFDPSSWGGDCYLVQIRLKINGGISNPSGPSNYSPEDNVVICDTSYTANTVYESQVYLSPGDYVEVYYALIYTFFSTHVLTYLQGGNKQVYIRDIAPSLYMFGGAFNFTSGKANVLSDSALVVETTGSMNGIPISDEKARGFFVNRFEFEEYLTGDEIIKLIENPQGSIKLINFEHGINTKTWIYNLSVNPTTGKTTFDLINNLANL